MMSVAVGQPVLISTERILLDLVNPRHEEYSTEEQAIAYLCKFENVFALAKDIAAHGLNPLDLFALIPETAPLGAEPSYTVAEGNRRMCAVKLLHDPDLAPGELREEFEALGDQIDAIPSVMSIVFEDRQQVQDWLLRIHGGEQGGVGRRPWSPEQKARHAGDRKNLLADAILNYAVQRHFISADQRRGKLTTAQRYLGNSAVKEALGIKGDSADTFVRTRPPEQFDELIKQFSLDVVNKVAHSRNNSPQIEEYAKNLLAETGVGDERVPDKLLLNASGQVKKLRTPQRPSVPKRIQASELIEQRLKKLQGYKLQKLYFSLCQISVEAHAPLIAVGVWSFFETLTAKCGRKPDTSFRDFLSKQKLTSLGITGRDSQNPILQAIARASDYGNTTKHHDTAGQFNGEQIVVDMDTLTDLVCRLADGMLLADPKPESNINE